MDIKRCKQSFRAGVRGFGVGDLVPAAHPLVAEFPGFFEPVADYVAHRFPQYADGPAAAPVKAPEPVKAKVAEGEHVASGSAVRSAAKKTAAPRRTAPKK